MKTKMQKIVNDDHSWIQRCFESKFGSQVFTVVGGIMETTIDEAGVAKYTYLRRLGFMPERAL